MYDYMLGGTENFQADRDAAGDDRGARLRYLGRATERELGLVPRLSPIAAGPLAGLKEDLR